MVVSTPLEWLTYCPVDRLRNSSAAGIELVRKQPKAPKPVREFPPARRNRQVDLNIPPVPKCDVEKLLSIEAMKKESLPSAGE